MDKKIYSQKKILSFSEDKILHLLYRFSQSENAIESLSDIHQKLDETTFEKIIKLNKEWNKVKKKDRQFEIYLMLLERFIDTSKKEYDFVIPRGDSKNNVKSNLICIIDSIRSAHNIGAFFRNADCFGVKEIILSGFSPMPQSNQVQKTAMGTINSTNWRYEEDLESYINSLKKDNYQVWAVEKTSDSISIYDSEKRNDKIALIFGHEQFGLNPKLLELSDKVVHINMVGGKNSLNVSVANGIILSYLNNIN